MELHVESDEDEFPPPLPPTKIPRPVTTEPMGQKFQCCVCRTSEGVLTCTRCKAVRYCDKACQKKQWPKHKDICAKIKAAFEETEIAADFLKTFKESPDSEAVDLFKQYFDGINIHKNVHFKKYDKARRELIYALESCGDDNKSELAFDLAAGNFMDMMMLRFKEYWFHEGVKNDLLSYLINANLDQEAFDFVMYFYLREKSQEPLPYLSIEPQDIDTSFTQSEIDGFPLFDIMAIALVKYKRMRHLEFQEMCEAIRFKNFMMGTHPIVGKKSPVLKIRGVSDIMVKLADFVLKPFKKRVLKLHNDIEILLKSANTNRYVIPGILNPETLPPIDNRPMWLNAQGLLEGHGTKEEGEEDLKVRDAWGAVEKTDRAWRLAMLQDKVFLEGFLSRGSLPKPSEMPRMEIMVNEHTWKGRECNLTDKELYGHSFSEVFRAIDKELYLSKDANLMSTELTHDEKQPVKQVDEFENLDESEKRGAKSVDKDMLKTRKEIYQEDNDSINGSSALGGNKKLTDSVVQDGAGKLIPNDVERAKVKDSQMDDRNSPKPENRIKGNPRSSTESNVEDYSTICWSCSKTKVEVKLYKCNGCRKARYCSRVCIEQDRPPHKNWCLKQQKKREEKITGPPLE